MARRALKALRIALTIAAITWIIVFFVQSRTEIAESMREVEKSRLALAFAVVLLGLIPGAVAWQRLVSTSVPGVEAVDGVLVYLRSGIGKYTPGGALAFAIQHRELAPRGATLGLLLRLFVGLALAACLAATILAIPALLVVANVGMGPEIGWLLIALALAVVAGSSRLRRWPILASVPRRLGLPTPRVFAGTTILMAFAWALTGSHLAILVGGNPTLAAFAISAFAFSAVIGVVFAALPGALGVRDGSLLAILALQMATADAMVATILSRVLIVFADVAGAAVATALMMRATTPKDEGASP